MTDLPDPLVPADVDLRDFPCMPIDVRKFADNDFSWRATATEWKAGFKLWLASWHQLPAGSLPANDVELAALSGLSKQRWAQVRRMAISGWVLCSDGRYYRQSIAEQVSRAWKAKVAMRARLDRRLGIESGEWAALRSAVFARDLYTCRYCGATNARLECDHIVPMARGGSSELSNLATACAPCNRSKGAKLLSEWVH